jgi:hypothetical protein
MTKIAWSAILGVALIASLLLLVARSLSIGMRQSVHEISVGAPPWSLGSWVG